MKHKPYPNIFVQGSPQTPHSEAPKSIWSIRDTVMLRFIVTWKWFHSFQKDIQRL